ncbi:MAG: hypothetical protein NXI24_22195 [bacterium]|nr:hypothetical protein [bacterium]
MQTILAIVLIACAYSFIITVPPFLNLYLRRFVGQIVSRYEGRLPLLELKVGRRHKLYLLHLPEDFAPTGAIIFKQRFSFQMYVDGKLKSLAPYFLRDLLKLHAITAIVLCIWFLVLWLKS